MLIDSAPTAYTKKAIDWLGASAIVRHWQSSASYDLHAVGLVQPPPSGRTAAVRIGAGHPYLVVEARKRVDQFDKDIPTEGVIVYRVQTSDPLGHAQNGAAPVKLLTPTALAPGQVFTNNGSRVRVRSAIPGGFAVTIESTPTQVSVPDVIDLPTQAAHDAVRRAGLVPAGGPNKAGFVVFDQTPDAGTRVNLASTVRVRARLETE